MAFKHDEKKGSLFKQDNWSEGLGSPMMTGSCKIDGKHYKIAAWDNTGQQSGKKYLGLKFELEEGVAKDENADPLFTAEELKPKPSQKVEKAAIEDLPF